MSTPAAASSAIFGTQRFRRQKPEAQGVSEVQQAFQASPQVAGGGGGGGGGDGPFVLHL